MHTIRHFWHLFIWSCCLFCDGSTFMYSLVHVRMTFWYFFNAGSPLICNIWQSDCWSSQFFWISFNLMTDFNDLGNRLNKKYYWPNNTIFQLLRITFLFTGQSLWKISLGNILTLKHPGKIQHILLCLNLNGPVALLMGFTEIKHRSPVWLQNFIGRMIL